MDDDRGLDLSLGLGGSSTKSNEKSNASHDAGPNGADRTSKILNDFRNFLNGGIPQQPQGSYFSSSPQSANVGHTSGDGNAIRLRTSTSSTERVVELDGEKAMAGDKRKNLYEEMNPHKKQESDWNSDLHKGRTSHISITTDDGSTADNEDVAESEAATSRPTPNSEESSKQHVDSRASTDASKDLHGKVTVGHPPYSLQSVSSLNVPSSITFKDAIPVGAPASSVYPVSGIIQPYMTGDQTQTLNAGNTPITFGYSHGQLPVLNKDSPWGMAGRPPLLNPYSGRPLSASGTSHGLSEGKQPTVEEGSSTRAEDDARANNSVVFRGNSSTEAHTENSFPSEYPAIRPGMAADLKFGGSGSLPNLPWVSTTGPGLNGRTISGVTYRFSPNQIKIVCACHGLHMSPEDFIQHASEEPPSAADSAAAGSSTGGGGGGDGGGGGGGLASFPGATSNASASAKS